MTVAELIEALSELPQHHLVRIDYDQRDPKVQQHTSHDGPWVSL